MYIMNPRVVVYPTTWFGRLFGKNWHVYLAFAVEVIRYNTRYADECINGRKTFNTLTDALNYADALKKRITGGDVTEDYNIE